MKNENHGIIVVCDPQDEINEHMLQIVTKARLLGQISGESVGILYTGNKAVEVEKIVSEYGVDNFFSSEEGVCGLWEYAEVITNLINEHRPKVILFQATDMGKNVAAVISARFEAGLTADCIDITYKDQEGFSFIRAAMCDSVIAQIKCINCDISMGTVKAGVFVDKKADLPKCIQCIRVKSNEKYEDTVVCLRTNKIQDSLNKINLGQYNIHFCIGRGAVEYVDEIFELAERYGACVTGTRPVIEEGILEKERQVGQSGKSVSPQIYVGFGVSGASQHLVGIRNASIVIAINSDPKASIFDYADYSIVANVGDILHELRKLA